MDERPQDEAAALVGWKEIAAYLGKSPRTAQRWESELGLPVLRGVAPDGTPTVRASRRDIDAWRQRQAKRDVADPPPPPLPAPPPQPELEDVTPPPLPPRRAMRWTALLLSIFAIGTAIGVGLTVTVMPGTRTATRFEVVGTEVRALTESDATVWTYPLGATARRPEGMNFSRPEEGDIDGDGVPEVAVSVSFARPEMVATESDAVLLFNRDGRLRWRVQPKLDHLRDDRATFDGPWRLHSVAFASASPAVLWIAYSHDQPDRPGIVLEVTPDGRQTVRYMQAGRIQAITNWRTATGDYIAVGGTDATTSLASVALISRAQGAATWPTRTDAPICAACPREPPAAAYLLPMSELNRSFSRAAGFVYRVLPTDQRLRIDTDDGPRPALLAWVDADLRVREAYHPRRYWVIHEGLRSEGRTDHAVDDCPDRFTPSSIRVWRPASGWTDDPVRGQSSSH